MKPFNVMFIAASSLLASHVAVANNSVPSHMIESIYPPYRVGDMHNYNGEAMVRVTRITAVDKNGQRAVLFSDKSGALLPMVELENIEVLINPILVEKEGEYHDLNVKLADEVQSINHGRTEHTPLPPKLAGTVLSLRGSVYIDRYAVTTNGLQF